MLWILGKNTFQFRYPTLHYVKIEIMPHVENSSDYSSLIMLSNYVNIKASPFPSVFLISLYGAPLAQRASYLALHSSLFGPVAQLIMIILSLTALTLC